MRPFHVLAVALLACKTDLSSTAVVTERDSAGIRIVENLSPQLGSDRAWTISPKPSLVIGADEQDSTHQLFRVTGAVRLRTGQIVIGSDVPPHLISYRATGSRQWVAGSRGGGPGEFPAGYITHLWRLAGDSVATWEYSQRRMQVFSPDGKFVRLVYLENVLDDQPALVGSLDSAGFVVRQVQRYPRTPHGEIQRGTLHFARFHPDGRFVQNLATLPGAETFGVEAGGQFMPWHFPFAAQPRYVARGGRFYYGLPISYSIEVRDQNGKLHTIIRKLDAETPLNSDLLDSARQIVMNRWSHDPDQRKQWQRLLEQAPRRQFLPAFDTLHVDADGNFWVQHYRPVTSSPYSWSVFDIRGQWLTDVGAPKAFRVLDIERNHLLVLARDSLGVERVEVYALLKPEDAQTPR